MIDELLKLIGSEGFPVCLDEKYRPTWDAFEHTEETPRARLVASLGFFHLLNQAGVKTPAALNPKRAYQQLVEEELAAEAKAVARQLLKYRVLDVCQVFKSSFKLSRDLRQNSRILRFDLCLEPRRKAPMGSVLSKLQGLLYTGNVPDPLREVWRKAPVNSTAKPKSARDTYRVLMAQDSNVGRLPLHVLGQTSINVVRAAGDLLVLRIVTHIPNDKVSWMRELQYDTFIKQAYTKAFLKLKA